MDVVFGDAALGRLEVDPSYKGGFSKSTVKGFRKVMQLIRAAEDERDFYAMRSLHFEKLKGDREGQRSMRLNKQWRLILEIVEGSPKNSVRVLGIEDYH